MSARERVLPALLREHHLVDAVPDAELEAVVRLAAAVTGVRRATLNLLDDRYQHQVATTGSDGTCTPREDSMCAVHLLAGEVVHVPDAAADPAYAANPWVDGRLGRVRSYSSAPLVVAGGEVVGTLCAVDEEPRRLGDDQLERLADLARLVVSLFERRREARRLEHLAAEAEEQRELLSVVLAEAAERQELTDAVLDTIDVAVVACDTRGRLTLFNRAAHEWHGAYPDASLPLGEHPHHYRLLQADGTTELTALEIPLHRALVEGRVEGAEVVVAPLHRAPISATCSGRSLLRLDGTVLGAVVAMTDVTDDRARHAELVRLNTDLERFAAVAGHDLAAPLGVVSGYLELLVDERSDLLDEQALGWVATVQGGVLRMQSLISSLLAHARSGAALTSRRPTDLGAVLDLAVADLAVELERAGARVRSTALPEVQGDPVLLQQLLQNLVGNAVKHRVPGEPCLITVSALPVEGPTPDAPPVWEVSVADRGRGVPPEHREAVFEMFTAVDPAARRGHGIGLATCRRIVERHGGTIRVEETPGGGATFRFTLPPVTDGAREPGGPLRSPVAHPA